MANMDDIKGKAKEAAGDLTDDKDLQREGKVDQAAGPPPDEKDRRGGGRAARAAGPVKKPQKNVPDRGTAPLHNHCPPPPLRPGGLGPPTKKSNPPPPIRWGRLRVRGRCG